MQQCYMHLTIWIMRDFYLDIQKTAEQRMQEITLKDVLEQYHMKLEGTLLQRL